MRRADEDDDDEDDGVRLDPDLIQSGEVVTLNADLDYIRLKKTSGKARDKAKTTKQFVKKRGPIRANAAAARKAYAKAAEAQLDTPDVQDMLQVNYQCINLTLYMQVLLPGNTSR